MIEDIEIDENVDELNYSQYLENSESSDNNLTIKPIGIISDDEISDEWVYSTAITFTLDNKYKNVFKDEKEFLEKIENICINNIKKITYIFISIEQNRRGIFHAHVLVNHTNTIDVSIIKKEWKYSKFLYCEPIISNYHFLNYINKFKNKNTKEIGLKGIIPFFSRDYIN